MKLNTDILGAVEFEESEIIYFQDGLYGFEEMKRFILLAVDCEGLPFQWLQSIDDEHLSFVVTTPFAFYDPYEFEISDTIIEQLKVHSIEDLTIYVLIVLKEELEQSTMNLKAPLLINSKQLVGKQLILNETYPYKHYLFAKKD